MQRDLICKFAALGGPPVEVELVHDFKRLYPGSSEEPPDYDVRSRLYVNGVPVNPLKCPRIMRRLERQGG